MVRPKGQEETCDQEVVTEEDGRVPRDEEDRGEGQDHVEHEARVRGP